MQRHCCAAIVAVALTLAAGSAAAQDASADQVKSEVQAAWDRYIEVFSDARTDLVASEVYAAPSYQIGANGGSVRMSEADVKAAFDRAHAALSAERYDRSETDTTEICVLNSGAALLTAYFTRYRTDDSVIIKGASAYLFGKVDETWRIIANIGNPERKLVGCD